GIRYEDLSSTGEDAERTAELVWAVAEGTELGPPHAGHVVHPHDAVVVPIRHVDLPGADGDAERPVELVHAAAEGTERSPPRAGHVIHPHDAVVVLVRHIDLPHSSEAADPCARVGTDAAGAAPDAHRRPRSRH